MRILIADDYEAARRVIRWLFEGHSGAGGWEAADPLGAVRKTANLRQCGHS